MKKAGIFLLSLLLLLLCGCRRTDDRRDISGQRVVGIRVIWQSPGGELQRSYRAPEKIHAILHAMRRLEPSSRATVLPQAQQRLCIILTCADGSKHCYRQIGDTCFQAGPAPWQQIDPSGGEALLQLVARIPGDFDAWYPDTGPQLPRDCRQVYFPALRRCPFSRK